MSANPAKRFNKCGGTVIRPQPYSDKSVVESVVDFFQDVAYSQNAPKVDEYEKIQWVRFEQADINDLNNNPDCNYKKVSSTPLLLIIGYSNGVQIWTVMGNGEGQEVLSLRQGPVRVLRLMPTPKNVFHREDTYSSKRPLMSLCDASSAGQPYCSVKFVSLRSGDEVYNIPFGSPVLDIKCNQRSLVVVFKETVAVLDSCQYKPLFWIISCYPYPSPHANPVALSDRWIAYADRKLVPVHQSCGGMSGDGSQSYAATVISAAKTVTKGLTIFGQTVANSFTGGIKPGTAKKDLTGQDHQYKPGVVTVLDIQAVKQSQISVREDQDGKGIIAHFPAHSNEPICAMEFDPSGMMVLTADKLGHNFHLFRIMAHTLSSSQGAVHHLYTLYRGDTTAKVQDIVFTSDSRWVSISTYRGTSHIFPITPYGGSVSVRTHTSSRVVNRASRFHRSAGLEDISQEKSGRDSPVGVLGSPGSSPRTADHYRHLNVINNNMGNPRLPPFPHPTTVTPVIQIRQKNNLPGIGGGTSSTKGTGSENKVYSHTKTQTPTQVENVCVAACFSKSRGWIAGSPGFSTREKDKPRAVESLYIMSWTGILVEHILEPHAKSGTDKITEQSPLEVTEVPRAQWILRRSMSKTEIKPPLSNSNPLIVACDAIISQKPSVENITRVESKESLSSDHSSMQDTDDQWLSQVEIITYAGPHRRLWMGPQFSFKTFQGSSNAASVLSSNSSVLLSQSPEQQVSTMDIVKDDVDLHSLEISPTRSSPVAVPPSNQPRGSSSRHTSCSDGAQCPSPTIHTFIEAGSYEQSPNTDGNCDWPEGPLPTADLGDSEIELQQSLADAMSETPVKQYRTILDMDTEPASLDNLSTSSGSASSAPRILTFDASPQPVIDTVLVFPSSSESTDASQ